LNTNPSALNDFGFYLVGITLILLGIAFLLIPILASSGALRNVNVPPIILYIYNRDGFYFATSPILIIISLISIAIFLLRR
jgi:hypothetical protein